MIGIVIICKTRSELSALLENWRANNNTIAAAPTMGALHDGHLSLIDKAKEECDRVIATIFVNPLQFAPHEDFDTYPRTLDSDAELLEARGV